MKTSFYYMEKFKVFFLRNLQLFFREMELYGSVARIIKLRHSRTFGLFAEVNIHFHILPTSHGRS
jgi:hypothetical protein